MSVVYITHHNESIYDSTKITREVDKKPPAYKSKFTETIIARNIVKSKDTKKQGILGKPKQPPPDPLEYLKKNTYKLPIIPCTAEERDEMKQLVPKKQLPPVPKRDEVIQEQDAKFKREPKKFITQNVKMVLSMKPKEPEQNIVLDCYGTKKNLKEGLEPHFIYTNLYGKTPYYLKQFIAERKKRVQHERDKLDLKQPQCEYVTSEERENLLTGLKKNWEDLQKQYQGLPILTDTIPKKIRKTKMEADLKQLEKDIVLIERHPFIYVYDDEIIDE